MVNTLGKTIKEIRKLKKIKQKDLAALLGVSERTLLNYERGDTIPSLSKLIEISKILGISSDILFDTVEGKEMLDFNESVYIDPDPSTIADYDQVSIPWNSKVYQGTLEKSFVSYIESLIKLSDNSKLKSIHFTPEDYKKLIKFCNSSILNILDLYYESNPIILSLENLETAEQDDCNE